MMKRRARIRRRNWLHDGEKAKNELKIEPTLAGDIKSAGTCCHECRMNLMDMIN